MDHPRTARACVTPSPEVISRYWAATLSAKVILGNFWANCGVFDGDMLSPFPNSAGMMMKYLLGSKAAFSGETTLELSAITFAVRQYDMIFVRLTIKIRLTSPVPRRVNQYGTSKVTICLIGDECVGENLARD